MKDEIHLWRIKTKVAASDLSSLGEHLSYDEKTKASCYFREKDREIYTIRRAATREILGFYLETAPASVSFSYNRFGKLELAANNTNREIKFNVTQTRDEAFCAVACGGEIGIDAERVEHGKSNSEIAEQFFAEAERDELGAFGGEAQTAAFYRCWTRKEALVKATGEGLSRPLDSFRVSTGAEILSDVEFRDAAETVKWNLLTIAPDDATILSIACQKPISSLRFFEWTPDTPFYTPTALCAFDFAARRFSEKSIALV